MGYLGLYALRYYCRLEIKYCSYYHHHQIAKCGCQTFIMTLVIEAPNHVVSQTKQVFKEWKKKIGTCQELAKMEKLSAQAMEAI